MLLSRFCSIGLTRYLLLFFWVRNKYCNLCPIVSFNLTHWLHWLVFFFCTIMIWSCISFSCFSRDGRNLEAKPRGGRRGWQWVQVLKVPGQWVQVRLHARDPHLDCASKATLHRSSGAWVEARCFSFFDDVRGDGWIYVQEGMGMTPGCYLLSAGRWWLQSSIGWSPALVCRLKFLVFCSSTCVLSGMSVILRFCGVFPFA